MKKILMILTSHEELINTDDTTGLWIGEFTDPYYEFIDKGYVVTLASPKGGHPPIDPMSKLTENITSSNRRFNKDEAAQRALQNTVKLDSINASDYDGIFFPGGHGPMWDLASNAISGQLIIDFLESNRPVAAVCHGPAALIKAAEMKPSVLSGKRVTGYTNMEETLSMRADNIPYKLQDRLKELGADFHSALVPFLSNVEIDGLLITGQNPASAGPAAEALIEKLESLPAYVNHESATGRL